MSGEPDEDIPAQVVMGHQTGSLSPAFFRGLVAEMEKLNDEAAAIAEQKAALRKAAKDRGVNMKAFALLIRRRAMNAQIRADMDESHAIYERVAGEQRGIVNGGEMGRVALPPPDSAPAKVSAKADELKAWLGGNIG